MKVIKENVERWAYDRMWAWPARSKPSSLLYDEEDKTLEYDLVIGYTPTHWRHVHLNLRNTLWGEPNDPFVMEMDIAKYIAYIFELLPRVGYQEPMTTVILGIMQKLRDCKLTPVRDFHGDCTMQNVLLTSENSYKYFDPGLCHGLPCRELDEAKLLQSCNGFCELYRGTPTPVDANLFFPTKPVMILSMSHYIRLLAHVKHAPSLEFARSQITRLMEILA
jgi:hypothetical protein